MTQRICGIDEAGRGPLIGNVVAGAVILHRDHPITGLKDSKKLSAKKREQLSHEIQLHASWGIGQASPEEIDQLNILQATMLAMQRAHLDLIHRFRIVPELILVDGNRAPIFAFENTVIEAKPIIQGDALEACISAASIIAKVTRDLQMQELDQKYPEYGFAKHNGYPTKDHLERIQVLGLIPGYRKSFAPVRRLIGV